VYGIHLLLKILKEIQPLVWMCFQNQWQHLFLLFQGGGSSVLRNDNLGLSESSSSNKILAGTGDEKEANGKEDNSDSVLESLAISSLVVEISLIVGEKTSLLSIQVERELCY
jgi:hypothetical protein